MEPHTTHRTIRRTSVALPALSAPGLHLSDVTSLEGVSSPEGARVRVAEFQYDDAGLRDLDLAGTHLVDGRVRGLTAQRVRFEGLRVDSVEFSGCELSSLRWTDSKVPRAVFRDCRLVGAVLEDLVLDNVLFEDCKLDYSTFTHVRTAGPVIFSRCSLRESAFTEVDLGATLLDAEQPARQAGSGR